MPAYNAATYVPSIEPGSLPLNLIVTADVLGVNFISQQVCIASRSNNPGKRVRLDGTFSGAPGTFEVDIYESSIDSPNNYSLVGSASAVDANQHFGIDLIDSFVGPFLLAKIKSLANVVTLILAVSEQ